VGGAVSGPYGHSCRDQGAVRGKEHMPCDESPPEPCFDHIIKTRAGLNSYTLSCLTGAWAQLSSGDKVAEDYSSCLPRLVMLFAPQV
jgi:hypothetical protein